MSSPESPPALFHVTHAKSGSTWIANILAEAFPDRIHPRFGRMVEKYRWTRGAVYPGIFLPYPMFLELERDPDSKVFYVIRDIRDTLVSLYFSLRYTHEEKGFAHVKKFRGEVEGMSDEEGLLLAFRKCSARPLENQKSWLESGEHIVRYEDLIANEGMGLLDVFDEIGMPCDRGRLEEAIRRHWFENVFGRKLGERDDTSHGRQGLPGDWRNYATPEILEIIGSEFAEVLEMAGYDTATEFEPSGRTLGEPSVRVDFVSENAVMSGASYLFTGTVTSSGMTEEDRLRLRVRLLTPEGPERVPLSRECPNPLEPWTFRASRRVPFGVSRVQAVFETRRRGEDWRVLRAFEFPVRHWPRERNAWIRAGIVKYASILRYVLVYRFLMAPTMRFPRLTRRMFRTAWRHFLRMSDEVGPREAWEKHLGPIERVKAWSSVKVQRGNLGQFHHYEPREVDFDSFPEPAPGEADPALPALSVVTPSYNQGAFLAECMDSVLAEGDIDYLVMDGGSSDGSAGIIEERAARLKYWQSHPDGGQASAIREGFRRTEGKPEDLMAYLNSDDFYSPGAIAHVRRYFAEHPEVDVVYGHRVVVDHLSREIGRWVLPPHDPDVFRLVDYVPQETLFWRRRLYDEVGGIDSTFRFAMDWDLLLRFERAGAVIKRLPWFLAAFRVHGDQKTQTAIADAGMEEMRHLRVRENGGSPVLPEKIWEAVRKAQVESWWYGDQLRKGNRI